MQNISNLFRFIHDEDIKSKGTELGMAMQLQRAGLLPRSLGLHERQAASGHQDETVRHAVHARTDILRAHAAGIADGIDQFSFDFFL